MPELPEVEAVCRKLVAAAQGAGIVRAVAVRPAVCKPQTPEEVEQALAGCTLQAVERRGKNILLRFSGGRILRVHLRMTGNLYFIPDARFLPAATRFYLELSGGGGIVFDDPRALGRISLLTGGQLPALFAQIGPEPLAPDFTAESFVQSARNSRKPAKLYLMDQASIAGLGNIYAAEALFQAGIHPATPMNRISPLRLKRLHAAILDVLTAAVDSAVAAYSKPGVFSEGESYPVAVYGREGEPCFRCGRSIRRVRQGGRSTYHCPHCQRR